MLNNTFPFSNIFLKFELLNVLSIGKRQTFGCRTPKGMGRQPFRFENSENNPQVTPRFLNCEVWNVFSLYCPENCNVIELNHGKQHIIVVFVFVTEKPCCCFPNCTHVMHVSSQTSKLQRFVRRNSGVPKCHISICLVCCVMSGQRCHEKSLQQQQVLNMTRRIRLTNCGNALESH